MTGSSAASRVRRRLLLAALLAAGTLGATAATAITATAHASAGPTIQRFPLPGGAWAFDSVFGPDGALWFTATTFTSGSPSGAEIGRMTTSGAVRTFALPAVGDSAPSIVAASGALWFIPAAVQGGNGTGIGRISTTGSITEFPAQSPSGIAAGPDGNVWVGDSYADATSDTLGPNAVDQVTPSGAIQQLGLPFEWGSANGVTAITTGPDGALWIAGSDENENPAIGRLTTTGAFTSYSVPDPGGNVQALDDITVGPDGALWFTVSNQFGFGAGWIGRITTRGQVTEFRLGNGIPTPNWITRGPDGALWFTASVSSPAPAGLIGRVTTTGKFSYYYFPHDANAPTGIVTGPDRHLWIAFFGAIGRLDPAAHPGQLSWATRSKPKPKKPSRPKRPRRRGAT